MIYWVVQTTIDFIGSRKRAIMNYSKFQPVIIVYDTNCRQTIDSSPWQSGPIHLLPLKGCTLACGVISLHLFYWLNFGGEIQDTNTTNWKDANIKNVVIGGFLTNFCVESTARSAYDKGYAVTIMKDATAANSMEEQNHSEEKIFPLLGQTIPVDQFLNQLEE